MYGLPPRVSFFLRIQIHPVAIESRPFRFGFAIDWVRTRRRRPRGAEVMIDIGIEEVRYGDATEGSIDGEGERTPPEERRWQGRRVSRRKIKQTHKTTPGGYAGKMNNSIVVACQGPDPTLGMHEIHGRFASFQIMYVSVTVLR